MSTIDVFKFCRRMRGSRRLAKGEARVDLHSAEFIKIFKFAGVSAKT